MNDLVTKNQRTLAGAYRSRAGVLEAEARNLERRNGSSFEGSRVRAAALACHHQADLLDEAAAAGRDVRP